MTPTVTAAALLHQVHLEVLGANAVLDPQRKNHALLAGLDRLAGLVVVEDLAVVAPRDLVLDATLAGIAACGQERLVLVLLARQALEDHVELPADALGFGP